MRKGKGKTKTKDRGKRKGEEQTSSKHPACSILFNPSLPPK